MNTLFRKTWIRFFSLAALATGIALGGTLVHKQFSVLSQAESAPPSVAIANSLPPKARQITTYRSPTCGCCGEWVKYMQAQGFQVQDNIVEDLERVKREHHVPEDLASCHTSIANGYVIEGHIPAADVKRLLTQKPDVVGIAVPGMPIGSPGMESGNLKEPYTVYTFDQTGQTTAFTEHNTEV